MSAIRDGLLFWVLLVVTSPLALCSDTREALTLRYKGEKNVSYLIERSLKLLEKQKNNETTSLHEKTLITYGPLVVNKNGEFRLTPKMHRLSIESNMGKLQRSHTMREGWIFRQRDSLGMLPKQSPAHIAGDRYRAWILAQMFDPFPLFPRDPVQQGSKWEVTILMALNREEYIFPTKVVQHFSGFERINGVNCAKIEYSLTGNLRTAEHPEMLKSRIAKQIKPEYTLSGHGTVYFDPEAGIIVRKVHEVKWTKEWTGKLDPALVRKYPSWVVDVDQVTTCRITAELIPNEVAVRLVEEVKKRKAARAPRRWTYHVKRIHLRNDKLRKREKTVVDHALVRYGAGKPQISYVDEQKQPLQTQRPAGARFQPFAAEKLSLRGELPSFRGPGSGMGWPVQIVANAFDILPMKPEGELAPKKKWDTHIEMTFGGLPKTKFTAKIEQVCKRYEWKQNRRCLKVEYVLRGKFKSADHPDLFTAEELKEHRAEYSLYGKGVAYYDPEAEILVDKFQTISWHSTYQRLRKLADGKVGWVPTADQTESVEIVVSLHQAE